MRLDHDSPLLKPGAPNGRRLVVADDCPEMRWLVRSAIGGDFTEVVEAADGRELFWALLSSARNCEQVIVTDLRMPAYDGLDIVDAWRAVDPHATTVVITAFPSDDVRARARKLDAVLLAKPFSMATLQQAIREASHAKRGR